MPEGLEAKKAELEILYREFTKLTARLLEIFVEVPRMMKPLAEKHGTEGILAGAVIFAKFVVTLNEFNEQTRRTGELLKVSERQLEN